MKNSRFNQLKGIALAVSVFLLCIGFNSSVFAQVQSNCFTISVDTTSLVCEQGDCGTPSQHCTECRKITITHDKCAGLVITDLVIISKADDDCHTVCSPSGNFTLTSGTAVCSWANPRVLTHSSSGGISWLGTATFMICHTAGGAQSYKISLPSGTTCGGTTCTDAEVTF
jgi:hypothetical protein